MTKRKKQRSQAKRSFYAIERERSQIRTQQKIQLITRFDRLHRWLLVLHRWQHRIEFEYTIHDDSSVYLRFRGPIVDRIDEQKVFRTIDGRGDLGWWPQASSCKDDGVLQFEVRFAQHAFGVDTLRHELAWDLLELLRKLPERSAAAVTEIPRLNSAEIMQRMMAKMQREYEAGAIVYVRGQPVPHVVDASSPALRLVKLRSPRIVKDPADG